MQDADSPMALFQIALPMLMSKRGKRGRNESFVKPRPTRGRVDGGGVVGMRGV